MSDIARLCASVPSLSAASAAPARTGLSHGPGAGRPGNALSREPPVWWLQRRDAACNWIALGLLLAAWNACDNEAATRAARPGGLRGYASVSVRAAERIGARGSEPASVP